MANVFKEQKLIDTSSRALLKYIFISDGTQTANTLLVDVSSLAYAMNANNMVMVANVHPKGIYKTKVRRIFGHARSNGYITLQWQGSSVNTEISTISSGSFDIDLETQGVGAAIDIVDAANSTGDIVISTFGSLHNDSATIFIELRKDPSDYATNWA